MKKQVSPAAIVIVVLITVVGLGYFLYRAMQPAYYLPSPGVAGRPATGTPEYAKRPGDSGGAGSMTPVVPPAGSRAGDPRSMKH
jgi:hypothetical protein